MGSLICSFCHQSDPPLDAIPHRSSFTPGYLQVFPLLKQNVSISTQISQKKDLSLDDFTFLKLLGFGASARIFLVRKKSNGKLYAMKVLNKRDLSKRNHQSYVFTELAVLQQSACPFICKLKFSFQTEDFLYLGLEFLIGGDLFFHLHKARKFNEETARRIGSEIIVALEYLHEKNVVYRDLKPENVLFDKKGHIRLVDFGLAKILEAPSGGKCHSMVGTPEYVAPEVILRKGYDCSVDYWNLGCVMHEMLLGRPAFLQSNIDQLLRAIVTETVDIPDDISLDAKEVILGLMEKDPKKRVNSKTLKKMKFFANVDWEKVSSMASEPAFQPVIHSGSDLRNFEARFSEAEVLWNEGDEASSQNIYEYYMNFSFKRGMESTEEKKGEF